ncbi:uncharacterized protein LTR77_002584 [Saxophila tyrrhenica]|uniref:BZIP domain-containing protein n=1 Tax=Saxophila tyrrhenica TaxID=1690608 RepID=A0AAV9PNT9_9PEZI|nr:hypothetical protein LTR77_002584 [Saxophila tyrrhenica]
MARRGSAEPGLMSLGGPVEADTPVQEWILPLPQQLYQAEGLEQAADCGDYSGYLFNDYDFSDTSFGTGDIFDTTTDFLDNPVMPTGVDLALPQHGGGGVMSRWHAINDRLLATDSGSDQQLFFGDHNSTHVATAPGPLPSTQPQTTGTHHMTASPIESSNDAGSSTNSGKTSLSKKRSYTPPSTTSPPKNERENKRQRNTEAARRYRQRKVDRVSELEDALAVMTKANEDLKLKLARSEAEVDVLRGLVAKR